MRRNVVIPGAFITAIALYYLYIEFGGLFLAPIGAVTMTLGILTSNSFGVAVQRKQTAPKLLVDKGVLRASIYMLAFFETRLVLKRIASSRTTILSVLILALGGLFVDGLAGGLGGAFAGYALQEFTSQRNRERIIKGNDLSMANSGDIEISYQQLRDVRLEKNRVQLLGKNLALRISLPRGYAPKIAPNLKAIFPGKYRAGDSVSPEAPDKEDE